MGVGQDPRQAGGSEMAGLEPDRALTMAPDELDEFIARTE